MIRGVVFDMDGVLVDSEAFIAAAAILMFRETYGIEVEEKEFLPFVGAGENAYLGGVARLHGIEPDIEVDKAKTYEIYDRIVRGRLKELPGARDFVGECRRRGLRTALATSADKEKMLSNLRELDLGEGAFDVLVNGLEVKRKKPHPDIYLEAARRLGLAPETCLVVEDAVNGVLAARRAGMLCLGVLGSFPEKELAAAGAGLIAERLSPKILDCLAEM